MRRSLRTLIYGPKIAKQFRNQCFLLSAPFKTSENKFAAFLSSAFWERKLNYGWEKYGFNSSEKMRRHWGQSLINLPPSASRLKPICIGSMYLYSWSIRIQSIEYHLIYRNKKRAYIKNWRIFEEEKCKYLPESLALKIDFALSVLWRLAWCSSINIFI